MYDHDGLPLRHVRRIHFVGIGGAGMSGIAEVLSNLGYQVSGSDIQENRMTAHLAHIGVEVSHGHAASHVEGADVVVFSSAIEADNVELQTARSERIPVIPRAEMLGELMRFKQGIAVAGTHGKTTTTSLIATVLAEGGLDPTFVIGGLVHSVDSHGRLGSGQYLVAEADESDASFLLLNPTFAVLTNIDADHMAHYGGDFARLRESFVEFFKRLPFYGLAVICANDRHARDLIADLRCRVVTYGLEQSADVEGYGFEQSGAVSRFKVKRQRQDAPPLSIDLNMPGRHNALNALAAIAIATELGVADEAIASALGSFAGIGRRCQVRGEIPFGGASILLIDDYGHHPTEIAATITTVREGWPDRRLLMMFQPHRYSRTRDLFEDFVDVLSSVEALVIFEVYSAGERPIPGADGRALCRAVRMRGRLEPVFVAEPEEGVAVLRNIVEDGDIVLVQGAGSVAQLAEQMTHVAAGERGESN